jgi:hypothetical protein
VRLPRWAWLLIGFFALYWVITHPAGAGHLVDQIASGLQGFMNGLGKK